MRILVQRRDSLGDVVDTTPVCARLRKEYPDAEIWFETNYKQVYQDNPDGVITLVSPPDLSMYDRVIDLNMAHERNMSRVGIVESYMEAAFGDRSGSTQLRLAIGERPSLDIDWPRAVTIHAARSWPQRTLPHEFWLRLADTLVSRGWTVIGTGTAQDWPISGKGIIDTRGWYDLKTQLGLLQASRCFIASQSGPQSFSQATDVPVVALMTMGLPWIVERERHGELGWRFYPIETQLECRGCQHRIAEPSTMFYCPRATNQNECVTLFDPVDIADVAEDVINECDWIDSCSP